MRVTSLALAAFALTAGCAMLPGLALAWTGPSATASDEDDALCFDFSWKDAGPSAPKFSDYRVKPGALKPVPAKVTPEFRTFRTMIRRGAAEGPNFAGHYSVALFGLAMGHRCFAIVDSVTGRINGEITPQDATWRLPDTKINCVTVLEGEDQEPQFRVDSRLLILAGRFGERMGVGYYVWTGSRLERVRFYPADEICRGRKRAAG